MFLSMAAMALTTYALLVLHSPLPTLSTPLAVEVCSEEARAQVWSSLPECRPRPTLIKLPLPRDPSILQVIHLLFEIHIPDHPNPTLTPRPIPGDPQPSRGGAMRGHLPLARRGPVPALCCRPHQKHKVGGTFFLPLSMCFPITNTNTKYSRYDSSKGIRKSKQCITNLCH